MNFDLIIRQGSVIDGTGAPRAEVDVGVKGDRIAAVGNLSGAAARREIDARGWVVAPGFIDVHNHSEGWLLKLGHLDFKTRQGFTTEVLMSDGISYAPLTPETAPEWLHYLYSLDGLTPSDYRGWHSIAEYLRLFEQDETRIAQNIAVQVPYANCRAAVMGWGGEAPTAQQTSRIRREIEIGMQAGGVGLSTGLDYVSQCYSGTEELITAAQAVAPFNGLYITHIRYNLGIIGGLNEAVEIAERAGVALHVSHLKTEQPDQVEGLLAAIDQAAREVDFTFDCYPYAWASSMLNMLLPYDVWEHGPLAVKGKLGDPQVREHVASVLAKPRNSAERIKIAWLPERPTLAASGTREANRALIGMSLAEIAAQRGQTPEAAVCDLLVEEDLAVLVVFQRGDDAMIDSFLQHPRFMLGSDGIYMPGGLIHPRCCGSAPRLLAMARERKLFTLEDAVRRMTSFPAQRFGLVDRGVIRSDAFADLVVFDPNTVVDRATYDAPYLPPAGIEHVIVNGTPIIDRGKTVPLSRSQLPGRALRYRS